MNHVTGIPRLQMQLSSLEDSIDQENSTRFVPARPFESFGHKAI